MRLCQSCAQLGGSREYSSAHHVKGRDMRPERVGRITQRSSVQHLLGPKDSIASSHEELLRAALEQVIVDEHRFKFLRGRHDTGEVRPSFRRGVGRESGRLICSYWKEQIEHEQIWRVVPESLLDRR